MEHPGFNEHINNSINNLMRSMIKLSLTDPAQASFLIKTAAAQKEAAKRRQNNEDAGLHIPAFMIASVTQKCNLHCKGCYSHAQHREADSELDAVKLEGLVKEARDLGISIILLAGGEPLVRKTELMKIAKAHGDVIFPIFTNGLLIDKAVVKEFKVIKNAVPVISIEGLQEDTDQRRGTGVHSTLQKLFKDLKKSKVLYGVSITVTTDNMKRVTDEAFIKSLIDDGCKLIFFIEYVPVENGTASQALGDTERDLLIERINALRDKHAAFFIAFPGDEKSFGGCIASGRGFIHVSPSGSVEPCPFAPFSDSSIKDKSLKECIQSRFLQKIRDNHDLLVEGQGGCALWEKKELIQSFLADE